MEKTQLRKRLLLANLIAAGGLALVGCAEDTDDSRQPTDAPYVENEDVQSNWQITAVDKVGVTNYHDATAEESTVFFVEYTDSDGNVLLCKENRPYRYNAGPTESCNWEAYNEDVSQPE